MVEILLRHSGPILSTMFDTNDTNRYFSAKAPSMMTIFHEIFKWDTVNTDNLRYHVKQDQFKIEVYRRPTAFPLPDDF